MHIIYLRKMSTQDNIFLVIRQDIKNVADQTSAITTLVNTNTAAVNNTVSKITDINTTVTNLNSSVAGITATLATILKILRPLG
ncbi:PxORF2 peptide [Plutella xylostella granulovirus]|uniref:PxORF2 peptide n=1 Tax=Plutella xylostella granulovirus TaxID=98383 RepID=Q9JGU8_9BBAC|nr:PxORF2 peptide [Plutella xylostella granulovirus]AAG27300.1 PxORF2 peptide [Plutella xylostella granulovirus]